MRYRLLTPTGDLVTEVACDTLQDATDWATNMGYTVLDTVHPEVVVVRDGETDVALSVVLKHSGECIITGNMPRHDAPCALRTIADHLEAGD